MSKIFRQMLLATISCADGIERKFRKLEELLAYENSVRAAVSSIEIFGSTSDRRISVIIGRSYGARAELSIRGEEQEATVTRARILDSFAGMRAWYSPIATLDLKVVWLVVFVVFTLVIQLMSPGGASRRPDRTFSDAVQALGIAVLYVAPVVAVILAISSLKARYLPMVSMAIGQGHRRYKIDEQIRWTVVVGLLVGLAGSAIHALISGI